MTPTDAQVAWAAGLFEGEGTIVITTATRTGHPRVGIAVASTDLDVLEKFQGIVGFGGIHKKSPARCDHETLLKLGVACGPCWEQTIRADEQRRADGWPA